jgi:thymidylate kinase
MFISFFGFQSAGKTSKVSELTYELRKRSINAIQSTDLARRCPLPINEDGTTNTQYWITAKMIQEHTELTNIYDIVISDRTPFDCVAYQLALTDEFPITLYNITKEIYKDTILLYVKKPYQTEITKEHKRSTNKLFIERSREAFKEVNTRLRTDLKNYHEVSLPDFHIEDLLEIIQ